MMCTSLRIVKEILATSVVSNKVAKSLRKAGNSFECQYTAVMGKGRRWNDWFKRIWVELVKYPKEYVDPSFWILELEWVGEAAIFLRDHGEGGECVSVETMWKGRGCRGWEEDRLKESLFWFERGGKEEKAWSSLGWGVSRAERRLKGGWKENMHAIWA